MKAQRKGSRWVLVTTLLAMVGAASIAPATAQTGAAAGLDREDFVTTHPGDVYVVDGETNQLTNPDDLTPADTPLYNVAGTRIGPTWGEWSGATAVSLAKTHATKDRTDIHLRFDGLIPGGVYSVFSVTFGPDSRHPLCVTAERGLPLTTHGATNGPDPSSFVAGPDGSATYHGRAEGVLLDADVVQLFLIYQFDGKTYHPLANYGESVTQGDDCRSSYGADAMRQLVIFQKWPG